VYQLVRALSSYSRPTGAGSSADAGGAPALAKDVSLFLMDCSKGESECLLAEHTAHWVHFV